MNLPTALPDVTIFVTGDGAKRPFCVSALPRKGPRAGQEVPLGDLPSAEELKSSMEDLRWEFRGGSRQDASTKEEIAREQGNQLWSSLSSRFQTFYREDLASDDVRSIAICGPDTYFPWELIWPIDGEVQDALSQTTLGITFSVARWPTRLLPNSFPVSSLDAIVGPDVPTGLQTEFEALKLFFPLSSTKGASSVDLKGLFDNPSPRILHIAAHGRPTTIALLDRPIETWEISDGLFGRLTDPTLVFLNSCRTGGVRVLTEDEAEAWPQTNFSNNTSWAGAFIKQRCRACIVPMWNVVGEVAKEISTGFYERLDSGSTLGEAMQSQRLIAVTDDGDNAFHPTRFAYIVYGHPNAKVTFDRE